jgi:hypothetical protein
MEMASHACACEGWPGQTLLHHPSRHFRGIVGGMTETYHNRRAETWERFLGKAKQTMGSGWWRAASAIEKMNLEDFPLQVQVSLEQGNVEGATKSLGKLLASHRGWLGDLRLESEGSPKGALHWRILTVDQVLEVEG